MRRLCKALFGAVLVGIAGPALADPRGDFLLHCAGCHLADASGVPPYVPSLAGPLGRIAGSAEGRDYIARVPGAAQAPISDDALAAVLNWILFEYNRDSLPTSFKPLRGAEVANSRSRVLADPLKRRRELWPESLDERK